MQAFAREPRESLPDFVTDVPPALADTDIVLTVVRDAAQNVGIYGSTRVSGTVRVGDPVQRV